MSNTINTLLALTRRGIGHRADPICGDIDWDELQTIADIQGLQAIVIDGVEKLPDNQRPPKPVLLQWIGEVLQGFEYRYELYRRATAELAAFYNAHGYKMMVLKGYGCSINWPKPEHRPCGDIDIWQFGQQKEADSALVKEAQIKIDKSHHHHTVFNWRDFIVENHYDFINVHHHKSNVELEKLFKELGKDDTHFVELYGEKVYLPSPNLHALFLLRHCMADFASAVLILRQVLDWAFFVEKQGKSVDWDWLLKVLEQYHMTEFFNCVNAICVEDLGFEACIFPYVQFSPFLKDRIFKEIVSPEYSLKEPKGLLRRIVYKYRRWKAGEWKHKICYKESMWSAFWSGVWNHLLKPSSI